MSHTFKSKALSHHQLQYLVHAMQRSVNKIWKHIRTVHSAYAESYLTYIGNDIVKFDVIFGIGEEYQTLHFTVSIKDLIHDLSPEEIREDNE